jgi:hypothetical protein
MHFIIYLLGVTYVELQKIKPFFVTKIETIQSYKKKYLNI